MSASPIESAATSSIIARFESQIAGALARRARIIDDDASRNGVPDAASRPLLSAAKSLHESADRRLLAAADDVNKFTADLDVYG